MTTDPRAPVVEALVKLFQRAQQAAADAQENDVLGEDASLSIATTSAMPDITRLLDAAGIEDATDAELRAALARVRKEAT